MNEPTPANDKVRCPSCGSARTRSDFDESCGIFHVCNDCERHWSFTDENRPANAKGKMLTKEEIVKELREWFGIIEHHANCSRSGNPDCCYGGPRQRKHDLLDGLLSHFAAIEEKVSDLGECIGND